MAFQYKSQSITEPRTNSKISHTKWDNNEKLTPLDFDRFVPWFCLQFPAPVFVNVQRIKQDNFSHSMKKSSSAKSKSKELEYDVSEITKNRTLSNVIANSNIMKATTIKAFYNCNDQLVEISLINSSFKINKKVLDAINICLPFHKTLYKLKINRCFTGMLIYEISKLLTHSNITDICLDDNFVPEGNYYLLLEKATSFQNLSLRRCQITDVVCKRLANEMSFGSPASNNLLTLDLASNFISDSGAEYLGMMLRQNRTLIYLNISDNKITDNGAEYILNHLRIFPLTKDERIARNLNQLKYFNKKIEVYRKCKNEIINRLKVDEDKENQRSLRHRVLKPERRTEKRKLTSYFEELTIAEQAEKFTSELVGEFKYIYENDHIIRKDGQLYEIGNLRLSYLNLAYNNLGHFSILKICDVLKYQSEITKPEQCKGLLKIVLEGNNTQNICKELDALKNFLRKAISKYFK